MEILDDLVKVYNNRVHSVTKQKPIDIYLHKKKPYMKDSSDIQTDNFYQAKFHVGDYVRISKIKKTFEKGYTSRWSKEVFKIVFIDTTKRPYMYELQDLLGEEIKGKFYGEELQKTDLKDFSVVEKIVEERKVKGKKLYLIKYDGYSEKFNEWLTEEQLEKIM